MIPDVKRPLSFDPARDARLRAELSRQARDEAGQPLLLLRESGYGAGQLAQAVGQLFVELARSSGLVRRAECGVRGVGMRLGFTHESSPSVVTGVSSVGERPGSTEEIDPGRTYGGAR